MQLVIINVEDSKYALLLQLLKSLDYVKVVKAADSPPKKTKYDFSDLAGRLQWQGDAVEAQRRIRDKW